MSLVLISRSANPQKINLNNSKSTLDQARLWVYQGAKFQKADQFTNAIELYRKAESSKLEWTDNKLLFQCYYQLGSCYKRLSQFVLAENYLLKALGIHEVPNRYRSAAFNLLGNINSYNGLVEKSTGHHRNALKLRKLENDTIGLAETYNNLADLFIRQEDVDSAKYFLNQSLSFKSNKSKTQGYYYYNLARAFGLQALNKPASDAILKAISLFKMRKEPNQQANAYVIAAQIQLNILAFAKARSFLDSAMYLYGQLDDRDLLYQIYCQERFLLEKTGFLKKALEKSDEMADLKDTILSEAKLKAIAELETVYEFDKLNRSLAMQKEKLAINELEVRNRNLQTFVLLLFSLLVGTIALWIAKRGADSRKGKIQKEKLLYELNHRVKNNLSALAGALSMQKANSQNEETRAALSDVLHRVDAISTIHEFLVYSPIIEKENPELQLDQILRELSEQLKAGSVLMHRIDLKLNLEPCTIDLKSSLPLAMIANELITNSLKYAFSDENSRELRIELREENHVVILEIGDSGPGMINEDWRQKQTTGMMLINELSKQLNATWKFRNDNGLVFYLEMKKGR